MNNLLKILIAFSIGLAVAFYFINTKKSDTGASSSPSVVPIESSAMSGVVSSMAHTSAGLSDNTDSNSTGSNLTSASAAISGTATSGNHHTTEHDLPASVQETIRERRAGSQNSGVDKNRVDAASGAAAAYKKAEDK